MGARPGRPALALLLAPTLICAGCVFDLDTPWPDLGGADDAAADRGRVELGLSDGPAVDRSSPDVAPGDGPGAEGPTKPDSRTKSDGPTKPDGPTLCGNGKLDPGEACEGSKLGGKTCKALGYTGGVLTCGTKCLFDKSGCHKCGDQKKNGAEACDGADLGGKTCKALGHVGGTLKCSATCTLDQSACHDCGNGKLDAGEACDGTLLGGKTCKTAGKSGGTLECTLFCTPDTSGCYHVVDPMGLGVALGKNTRHRPHAAFDGTNYMMLWSQYTSGSSTSYDILGARLSPSGVMLDKTPFTVSAVAQHQANVRLAWGKGVFMATWTDYRSGVGYDIYVARLNTSGKVLDPAGVPVCTKGNTQTLSKIAFDGANFMVVWTDKRKGSTQDIYGARVTPAGKVLDKDGFLIRGESTELHAPDIAFGAGHYLVVWQQGKYGASTANINGVRVSTAGKLMDSSPLAISVSADQQVSPGVASDGTSFMVVWYDLRNAATTKGDIRGTLVDKSGKVLSPSGAMICGQKSGQSQPAITWADGVYWVVFQDYRFSSWKNPNVDVFGTRVSASGKPLDGDGIPVSTAASDQYGPSVVHGKGNSLALWEDKRAGITYEIYATRLEP